MERQRGKPVIGLSLSLHDFGDYGSVGFQRPIALVGGIGVALPRVDGHLDDALDICDGILLGGGRDIDPRFYDQEPTEHLTATEPHRDGFELELTKRAIDRGLPILGACRGIQILNVALGGTLVQDVALKPEWVDHPSDRGWKAWKEVERASLEGDADVPPHPRHPISVAPGSRLHAGLGVEEIEVDSFHHQALDRVASDLKVVARAPDGVVEAVELDGDTYALAVQWELQEEWRVDRRFLELFAHFVAAAAERRIGRAAEAALP
jgi:putative glutamine amidotransferase